MLTNSITEAETLPAGARLVWVRAMVWVSQGPWIGDQQVTVLTRADGSTLYEDVTAEREVLRSRFGSAAYLGLVGR